MTTEERLKSLEQRVAMLTRQVTALEWAVIHNGSDKNQADYKFMFDGVETIIDHIQKTEPESLAPGFRLEE